MVIRRLMGYLAPHKKSLTLSSIILILATFSDVIGPVLVKIFLDQHLVPRSFDRGALLILAISYVGLNILSALFHYRQLVSFNQIALKIVQQLRIDVFNHVQNLEFKVFDKTPAGALISRITNDTEAIKELFVGVLAAFVQNVVFMLGVFVAMFYLDVRLASFCLILLPIIFILMVGYRKVSTKVYRKLRKELSHLNAKLNESIQGMNIIQAMRQEKRFRQELQNINDDYYHAAMANIRLESLFVRPAVDLIYTFALIIILNYFGLQSITGSVQIGVLYAFINYIDRFFEPVNMMMQRLSQFQQSLVAAERVFELLDDQRTSRKVDSGSSPVIAKGKIEFKDVSFSYDSDIKGSEVLKSISFTAYPGQTVALVGHTGSGKSTIANLLLRFYPITQGEILIDGISVSEYSDQELRSKVGLVAQDPFLFVGTISSNISLARTEIKEKEVREAVSFVQAEDFIRRLPQGFQEPMGERGATLSSGQRQLICFARTIAGNPKILVLDEATANVDTETEEAIQNALKRMRQGRTTIAIAHRLSTIQDADLILVLHNGKIVERGTHSELLALEGLYYKMFLLQHGSRE
ncbi:ABC-type multidrug transport system, ATPase and permease component [Desulfosporosinus acidiphilus SJ4]|uniref:ABC-type multidrug transport system, ATPase and permease component n=1 Tax=Desulfosporosinus acidiphilus (strain DSM 22704 / JCM 16185 / SJ4) TaxID=646529 RepID=I4D6C8_DESAJ|nr:ABC transporter transmembrane domain-containing protein [Desulfosporosinus acidiphilus]AFM41352.1 ABC-type multidrug transport system, ATPase and permease component [Desulfosporosinus acidiphilus SJ4]